MHESSHNCPCSVPNAQTLLDAIALTPYMVTKSGKGGLGTTVQFAPSQCVNKAVLSRRRLGPAAQMSSVAVAAIAKRPAAFGGEGATIQAWPSQWTKSG